MNRKSLFNQFFLVDEGVARQLAEVAFINKSDVVLEIGAGKGIITREIAKKAAWVWAVEIDKSFKEDLQKLPPNVKVIFGDALKVLKRKLNFNKIVSNLPSSLLEPLILRLIHLDFKMASFLVPLKSLAFLNNEIVTIYLRTQLIGKVSRTSFAPQPKTNWALVRIEKKPSPLLVKDEERFIRQYLYEHPQAKLKNALMKAIIKIYKARGEKITKNFARSLIEKATFSFQQQEKLVSAVSLSETSKKIIAFL